MSRSLHLDTHVGHNRRYSFMETPLEMHSTAPFPESNSSPSVPAMSSPTQQPAIEPSNEQLEQTAHHFASNEKERHLQEEGIISTYSNYPPPDQHPAHYAPYAETPQHLQPVQSPLYSYSPRGQPPNSPGPLPVKMDPEAPQRNETLSIAPDANPLQSPKLPYFPPPTAAPASQAPTVEDLSSYHQPGQIMHPNQEVQGGTWSHGLCECSNIGTCCLGVICPCILYGKTQYRLSMKSQKRDPTNMLGYQICNGSCTGMALLCGCQCEFTPCMDREVPLNAKLCDRATGYHPAQSNEKDIWNQWRHCIRLCPGGLLHLLHLDSR